MATREDLYRKSKKSCVIVGLPVGAHVYKGFCVRPGDDSYFTDNAEVDAYERVVMEDWLSKGFDPPAA